MTIYVQTCMYPYAIVMVPGSERWTPFASGRDRERGTKGPEDRATRLPHRHGTHLGEPVSRHHLVRELRPGVEEGGFFDVDVGADPR